MSLFGRFYRVFTFGESHSFATGCVIEGFPSNFKIDLSLIQNELNRRKPGQSTISTPRKQQDLVQCLSGIQNGLTQGSPLCFTVKNLNIKKEDYDSFKNIPRPGHADFTYLKKYGLKASSGGGRSSARETIGRVIAGSLAKQYLNYMNIGFASWVYSVANIAIPSEINEQFIQNKLANEQVERLARIYQEKNNYFYQRNQKKYQYNLESKENLLDDADQELKTLQMIPNIRCPHQPTAVKIYQAIKSIKDQKDSLGGIIQGCIYNLPYGLGQPVFDKIQALMAHAMLSIPATKGFQFGSGFKGTQMKGSQHNDLFNTDLRLKTNHSGGSLGGISTGQTFQFKVAFKPVSTISKDQMTSNLKGELVKLEAKGRHDPCVLPRAPPIVDNMAAMVIMQLLMSEKSRLKIQNE